MMSKNNRNNNHQKETTTTEEVEVNEEVVDKNEETVDEKEDNSSTEEKQIEDLKSNATKSSNTRIKEIDKEIEELTRKLNKTFSPIQQVTYDEQIRLLKAEKAKLMEKKLESTNRTLIGETMKDTSPTNNVIPAGRGIVLDSRGASLSMGTD
jgi:aminopeptidase N